MSFSDLPNEILEHIASHLLLLDNPFISPAPIVPLLQTCQRINSLLAFHHNSHLYSLLFLSTFDHSASARRLGLRTLDAPHLAYQLSRYSSAVNCIRRGNIYDRGVPAAFWACFALLTENDQKNRPLLDAAGLPDFVDEFVRRRLYEDSPSSNGWPKESPINSLALWLLWHTSTEERLRAETPARRAEIIRLVLPFVIVPFRYPSAYTPHNHFVLPLDSIPQCHVQRSISTAHGSFPIYRSDPTLTTRFYDRSNFKIAIPLASTAAKLIFFSRRQATPIGIPIHLPLNREHAIQLGYADTIGPTQEDVRELNQYKVVDFIPSTSAEDPVASPSAMHDDDWYRLTDCIDPTKTSPLHNTHYTYGSATGLWQGRILIPSEHAFINIRDDIHMREDFTEQQLLLNAAPLFMRLREYHCIDPQEPLPIGGANNGLDDGISNAWMPKGLQILEDRDAGRLVFNHRGHMYTYEAYRPGHANSHDEVTCNACLFRGTSEIVYREDDEQYLARQPEEEDDDGDSDTSMEEEDEDEEFLADASAKYDPLLDSMLHHDMDEDSDEEDLMDATDDDRDEEYFVHRRCDGVLDIALVGETDFKHGQAWNHYRFYGRVRKWDGLVALVRIPVRSEHNLPGLGVWVFSGYIVAGRNFVGTWRNLGDMDPMVPTLESSFAMTRREEGHS